MHYLQTSSRKILWSMKSELGDKSFSTGVVPVYHGLRFFCWVEEHFTLIPASYLLLTSEIRIWHVESCLCLIFILCMYFSIYFLSFQVIN